MGGYCCTRDHCCFCKMLAKGLKFGGEYGEMMIDCPNNIESLPPHKRKSSNEETFYLFIFWLYNYNVDPMAFSKTPSNCSSNRNCCRAKASKSVYNASLSKSE